MLEDRYDEAYKTKTSKGSTFIERSVRRYIGEREKEQSDGARRTWLRLRTHTRLSQKKLAELLGEDFKTYWADQTSPKRLWINQRRREKELAKNLGLDWITGENFAVNCDAPTATTLYGIPDDSIKVKLSSVDRAISDKKASIDSIIREIEAIKERYIKIERLKVVKGQLGKLRKSSGLDTNLDDLHTLLRVIWIDPAEIDFNNKTTITVLLQRLNSWEATTTMWVQIENLTNFLRWIRHEATQVGKIRINRGKRKWQMNKRKILERLKYLLQEAKKKKLELDPKSQKK